MWYVQIADKGLLFVFETSSIQNSGSILLNGLYFVRNVSTNAFSPGCQNQGKSYMVQPSR